MITWEALALGLLSVCTAVAGWFLNTLASEVRELRTCVAKQSERWVQHEDRHREQREDRLRNEKEIWNAISERKA